MLCQQALQNRSLPGLLSHRVIVMASQLAGHPLLTLWLADSYPGHTITEEAEARCEEDPDLEPGRNCCGTPGSLGRTCRVMVLVPEPSDGGDVKQAPSRATRDGGRAQPSCSPLA